MEANEALPDKKMVVIKEFKATIEVDDVPLKEYKDPVDTCNDDTKCVRYIEVPPSAIFKIKINFAQDFKPKWSNISIQALIDGVFWQRKVLNKSESGVHLALGERESLIEGRECTLPNGKLWLSPFKFHELESKNVGVPSIFKS